ncbi:MAG: molybdopterin molybdotransferase MoeA [Flavobacteriales bacterium]|nr:molybdopterin molybdotransferase MoeA [Flavobacteriales bacterium]
MISTYEARQLLQEHPLKLGSELIPLENATGRVVVEDIKTDRSYPPFDRATMDGIVIKWEEGITEWDLQGTIFAGTPQATLGEGKAKKIMTGAPVPVNGDTVIRREDLKFDGDKVKLNHEVLVKKGQSIHKAGTDQQQGEVIIPKGTKLDHGSIASLATVGRAVIEVKKLPRISLITTGDEVVMPHLTPENHQIRASHPSFIKSVFSAFNITMSHEHVLDDSKSMLASIERALKQSDVLILTGGVSKGEKDYIPDVLKALGVDIVFHRIAQKPGKPMLFGRLGSKSVFGLPGNPVSVAATSSAYLLPYLSLVQPIKVGLSESISFKKSLTFFCPVFCYRDGSRIKARPVPFNTSGDVLSLAKVTGFVELPQNDDEALEHSEITYWAWNPVG